MATKPITKGKKIITQQKSRLHNTTSLLKEMKKLQNLEKFNTK
jgi:hypothetical protein